MKTIVIFILLSFAEIANGQIGLGFGNSFGNNSFGGGFGNNSFGNGFGNNSFGGGFGNNSFGNGFGNNSFGGGFGNNFGGRQPIGGGSLGNNFNNNNNGGGGLGGNLGGSTSNTNSVSNTNGTGNTNNVYRPLTVGINSRRKDNNGYDYGVINAGTSPMFSGRTFQTPLRKIAGGTNSVASIRQYLRLNSREGQFEFGQGSTGQTSSNNVSISGSLTKAN